MQAKILVKIIERKMKFDALQEAALGNCLVRVRSLRLELPGITGRVGTWEIYRLPWHHRKRPVHTGEIDVLASESLAARMARKIATAFAIAFLMTEFTGHP
jgi:hypothetical protein